MTINVPAERITGKIYLIRGTRVMLDSDLAELYGVETRVLKQAVRRNIGRFPADFMFELTQKEYQSLRSQNVILKRGQHSKYPPFAFSEQGVAMLSSNSWRKMICPNEKSVMSKNAKLPTGKRRQKSRQPKKHPQNLKPYR